MQPTPFHYGSHYSNSGTVLHYLVRLPPFTRMFLSFQGEAEGDLGFLNIISILDQSCRVCLQNKSSDIATNGTNQEFSSTKCTEIWYEKFWICPIWGQSDLLRSQTWSPGSWHGFSNFNVRFFNKTIYHTVALNFRNNLTSIYRAV